MHVARTPNASPMNLVYHNQADQIVLPGNTSHHSPARQPLPFKATPNDHHHRGLPLPRPRTDGASGNRSPLLHSPNGGAAPLPSRSRSRSRSAHRPPSGSGPPPPLNPLLPPVPSCRPFPAASASPDPTPNPLPTLAAPAGATLPSTALGGRIATLRISPTTNRASASVLAASSSLLSSAGADASVALGEVVGSAAVATPGPPAPMTTEPRSWEARRAPAPARRSW